MAQSSQYEVLMPNINKKHKSSVFPPDSENSNSSHKDIEPMVREDMEETEMNENEIGNIIVIDIFKIN